MILSIEQRVFSKYQLELEELIQLIEWWKKENSDIF